MVLLVLAGIAALLTVIGLVQPRFVLPHNRHKKRTRGRAFFIYGICSVSLFFLFLIVSGAPESKLPPSAPLSSSSTRAPSAASKTATTRQPAETKGSRFDAIVKAPVQADGSPKAPVKAPDEARSKSTLDWEEHLFADIRMGDDSETIKNKLLDAKVSADKVCSWTSLSSMYMWPEILLYVGDRNLQLPAETLERFHQDFGQYEWTIRDRRGVFQNVVEPIIAVETFFADNKLFLMRVTMFDPNGDVLQRLTEKYGKPAEVQEGTPFQANWKGEHVFFHVDNAENHGSYCRKGAYSLCFYDVDYFEKTLSTLNESEAERKKQAQEAIKAL